MTIIWATPERSTRSPLRAIYEWRRRSILSLRHGEHLVGRHLREDAGLAVGLERAAGDVEVIADEIGDEAVAGDLHVRQRLPRIGLRVVGLERPERGLAGGVLVFAAGEIDLA